MEYSACSHAKLFSKEQLESSTKVMCTAFMIFFMELVFLELNSIRYLING